MAEAKLLKSSQYNILYTNNLSAYDLMDFLNSQKSSIELSCPFEHYLLINHGSYGLESQREKYQNLGRSRKVMESQEIFSRKQKGQGKSGKNFECIL